MEVEGCLLAGKHALITGAGKGIGREIALTLAENGADVCIASRTLADLSQVSTTIRENYGRRSFEFQVDVSDTGEVSRLIEFAVQNLGSLDIVVCAAGYPLSDALWERKLEQLNDRDFMGVFNIDVLGSFRIVKFTLPHFVRQKSGVFILFSSTPALSGYDKGAPYTVAKAAILGLVKEIAAEYGRSNIRSYAVAPGNIKTAPTFERLTEEQRNSLALESPMGRWGDPREVAKVCASLASENMSFVTGQTIVVDGGTVML